MLHLKDPNDLKYAFNEEIIKRAEGDFCIKANYSVYNQHEYRFSPRQNEDKFFKFRDPVLGVIVDASYPDSCEKTINLAKASKVKMQLIMNNLDDRSNEKPYDRNDLFHRTTKKHKSAKFKEYLNHVSYTKILGILNYY